MKVWQRMAVSILTICRSPRFAHRGNCEGLPDALLQLKVCVLTQRGHTGRSHIHPSLERKARETPSQITSIQSAISIEPAGLLRVHTSGCCLFLQAALAWVGCFLSILLVGGVFGAIDKHWSLPLMLASFGPTAALLYGSPTLPAAQPWNAMGGLSAMQTLYAMPA